MPLVDGFWEKGKCGYKLIQYMACGVPVVASPVGVNVDIVDGNECGMLAADIEDWRRCLDKLLMIVHYGCFTVAKASMRWKILFLYRYRPRGSGIFLCTHENESERVEGCFMSRCFMFQ